MDTGNYNRSPLIEVTLKSLLNKHGVSHIEVESAGTRAQEENLEGQPGDSRTNEVLKEKAQTLHPEFRKTHVDDATLQKAFEHYQQHRVRQLRPEMIEKADLILFTDTENRQRVMDDLKKSEKHAHLRRHVQERGMTVIGYAYGNEWMSKIPGFTRSYTVPDPYHERTQEKYRKISIAIIFMAHKVFERMLKEKAVSWWRRTRP